MHFVREDYKNGENRQDTVFKLFITLDQQNKSLEPIIDALARDNWSEQNKREAIKIHDNSARALEFLKAFKAEHGPIDGVEMLEDSFRTIHQELKALNSYFL